MLNTVSSLIGAPGADRKPGTAPSQKTSGDFAAILDQIGGVPADRLPEPGPTGLGKKPISSGIDTSMVGSRGEEGEIPSTAEAEGDATDILDMVASMPYREDGGAPVDPGARDIEPDPNLIGKTTDADTEDTGTIASSVFDVAGFGGAPETANLARLFMERVAAAGLAASTAGFVV